MSFDKRTIFFQLIRFLFPIGYDHIAMNLKKLVLSFQMINKFLILIFRSSVVQVLCLPNPNEEFINNTAVITGIPDIKEIKKIIL